MPTRFARIVMIGSLGLTALLWALAWLFKLGVSAFFHSFLMKKFPGPSATYAAMAVCPIVAVILGIAMMRRGDSRRLGFLGVAAGGVSALLFAGIIGRALTTFRPLGARMKR